MYRRSFLKTITAVFVAPLLLSARGPVVATLTLSPSPCLFAPDDLLSCGGEMLRVLSVKGNTITVGRA